METLELTGRTQPVLGIPGRVLRRVAPVALLSVLAVVSGCAGGGGVRMEDRLAGLHSELASLGKTQAALARELAEVRGALQAAETGAAERLREDAAARDKALASLHEASQRILALESRVEALQGSVLRLEGTLDVLRDELDQLEAIAPPPRPEAARGSQPATLPEQLYARALERYRAGEFGQAVLGFEELIDKFPTHPLAGSAQYWIGEAYFVHRDFQQAVVELRKSLDLAPKGEKSPDALLRLGLAYRALKRPERAREVWEQLLRDFPGSEAAQRARVALREGRNPKAGPTADK